VDARRIDPSRVRARVIRLLAELSPDDHIEALHAIDAGEVQIDLTDPDTICVVIGRQWTFELSAREWHSN